MNKKANDTIDEVTRFLQLVNKHLKEKNRSLTAKERDQIVLYWLNKVIPVRYMFNYFLTCISTKDDVPYHDNPDTPSYEVSVHKLQNVLRIIEGAFPIEYRDTIEYRDSWIRKGEGII